jgi:cell division protein FtsB
MLIRDRTMNSDPDRILNQLVVMALTVFVTVSLLLAALVAREIWLQQQIVDLSVNLQASLEDLGDTTVEIQSELSELRTTVDDEQKVENLDEVAKLLTNVDQHLGTIEEGIAEVAAGLDGELEIAVDPAEGGVAPIDIEPEPGEPEVVTAPPTEGHEALRVMRDRADQTFTIFALLIGVAAVVIAVLLGIAIRVQERYPLHESRSVGSGVAAPASSRRAA